VVDLTTRDDGAIEWHVSTGGDLGALTSEIGAALDAAEAAQANTALVVRLPRVGEDRSWPRWSVHTDDVSRWERAILRMERSHVTTIAVLDGEVGGASLDLVLACTMRVATIGSVLHLPINDGQLWPGMGNYRFSREAGMGAARRVLLWSSELDMETCTALNVVDQTTSSLEATVHSVLQLVVEGSSMEVALRWNLLREDAATSADESLGMHLAACNRELRRLGAVGA